MGKGGRVEGKGVVLGVLWLRAQWGQCPQGTPQETSHHSKLGKCSGWWVALSLSWAP